MEPVQGTDPKKIGPYRIRGLLGAGGMGRVYLGVDKNKHKVAVKVVNAELLRDEEFRKRFVREATATAKVDGRFIAGIVASNLDGAHPWLATEYIDGTSLSNLVAQRSPLTPAEAQQMAAGLAEALTTIHSAGVVHRDVKPANVLLAEHDGQLIPHLIDFGIARDSAASTITRTGIVVGTPPYMAPEQIRGNREVGPSADIFALGGVLAFALTGRHPFGEGDPTTLSYRIAHEEPDLRGVEDEVIRKLIFTCLAKEPDERPTAPELLERVGDLTTRQIVPAPRVEVEARSLAPVVTGQPPAPVPTEVMTGAGASVLAPDADKRSQTPVIAAPSIEPEAAQTPGKPSPDSAMPPSAAAAVDDRSQTPVMAAPSIEPVQTPGKPSPPPSTSVRPPAIPHRNRRLPIAILAALALVILFAGLLGSELGGSTKKNPVTAAPGATSIGSSSSSPPDSPSGSGSSASPPANSASSANAVVPPPSGSPSTAKPPSPTGASASTPNQPSSTAGTSSAPGSAAGTKTTGHTTTPTSPHTTTTPPKPSTSNPPPRDVPPAAPTGAAASANWATDNSNDYATTFTWAPVSGATSYDVHYTFTDGNGHKKADKIYTGVSSPFSGPDEYSDPSSLACFQVRAVNQYGTSAWDSSPHCI